MNAATNVATKRTSRIDNLLHSDAYLFSILVFVIFSLILMVVRLLSGPGTGVYALAELYDNLICILFLVDFVLHMINEPVKRDYFIGRRGYFDLLGSLPTFGVFQYAALIRLFRVWRLVRLWRFVGPENRRQLKEEVLHNRGKYALLITVITALLVLMTASILVLFFESQSANANITTGGDALWWSIVTITTVGYGDKFPVTPGGRVTGVFVMVTGIGIIGALASIFASFLIPQPKEQEQPENLAATLTAMNRELTVSLTAMERELVAVKTEFSAFRQSLGGANGDDQA